jgi:MATE family multidrug resistance protein
VWTGWSRQAFKELWPYLKLALPGTAQICLEWWGFEVLMLLTGRLGATVSAAQTVIINTLTLIFMIPLAIGVAVTTRAGQALGAGDEALAKLTSKLSLIMIACVQSFIGIALVVFRHQWGYIFSSSPAVVAEVAAVLPLCGSYAVLDALIGVSSGILTRNMNFILQPQPHVSLQSRHSSRMWQANSGRSLQHNCLLGDWIAHLNSTKHPKGVSPV